MKAKKIFLFGYYGWKNVGDDFMLYILLKEIDLINSGVEYTILSLDPPQIPPEVQEKTRFVKPNILIALKEIARSSIFIVGGGTHISDYGNKFKSFKMLFRLLIIIFYTKFFGKNIYLINNGIGPLITTYGNILGWLICCMSSYISVRDQFSYNILKKWKMDDKSSLSFDLAVLAEPSYTRRLSSDQILGISITPVFEIYHASPEKDLLLVEQVSKCANRWLETKTNSKIYLFIFHGESKDDDVSITRLLNSKLINPNRVETIKYNSNPENVLNKVNECSAFIGMKYHSCVFAYMCDVPLLLIEYHPKCRYFAEEVELPNEAIVSLEEVLSNSIEKRFENFISFPGRYIARLSLNEARNRAKRPFLEGIFYENISS